MLCKKIFVTIAGIFLLFSSLQAAQRFKSQQADFVIETVATGLGVPWGMSFVASDRIIFTEREGNIKILDLVTRKITKLTGHPDVMVDGQGGMMDVAVSPGYKKDKWIYFTYVKDIDGEGATTLARAKLNGNRLTDWKDLLVTESTTDTGYHFGSRIAFDNKGHVYFGVGDRGVRSNGQDLSTHAGTVMRLYLDGSVPGTNPFINSKDVLPEIWSYGHRNPQGLVFDSKHKRLWLIEHGPRGGDEINQVLRGRNYGWPIISYGKEYWGPVAVGEGTHKKGMEQPVKQYTPSIAPGSLLLYTGKAFPKWQGNLFSGALALTHINRVTLDEEGRAIGEERLLNKLDERIRALLQSHEGWIYFSTDSGKIMRIKPAN